jgi:GAF domain-containing protein
MLAAKRRAWPCFYTGIWTRPSSPPLWSNLIAVKYDRWDYTLLSVSLVGAASSVACSQFTKDEHGGIRGWWLIGQIAAALIAVLAPAITAWKAKRAEADAVEREQQARLQSRVELNSGLDPVVRKLAQLSIAKGKKAQDPIRSEVMALVIAAAHQVVGTPNATRSCFFELVAGPPKQLKPTDHHAGRPGSTRSVFTEGNVDGDAAIGIVVNDTHWLCSDVRTEPPPGWSAKHRDYLSFISVPVVAGNVAYGMLSVDSTEANDFDRGDVDVIGVLAGLLAAALDPGA